MKVIIYLDKDKNKNKEREFLRVAKELSGPYKAMAWPAHSGQRLLELADCNMSHSVDHLIFICHGFPNRLLSARAGVNVDVHNPPAIVSVEALAEAWSIALKEECRITLGACLCSRSPARTLRQKLGRAFSTWGPHIHCDGGEDSLAAWLRDELAMRGHRATVRGHTTAAHVLHNPACREHGPEAGTVGRSLFNLSLEPLGVEATWRTAKRFNNLVKGELAKQWLLFAPNVEERIAAAWQAGA